MLPLFAEFRNQFDPFLESQFTETRPTTLYRPIQYLMGLGGKRLRPYALWLTTACYDPDNTAKAIPAAYALELFHAFTLVHDDIMDEAPMRRGHATVHEAYDTNTAILSGDAMMVHCMDYLLNYYDDAVALGLSRELAKTAIGVCQGQQLDMDFANLNEISLVEYLEMIEAKTAILLGSALRMGAMVGGATIEDSNALYLYGKQTGVAFQIQDDYLDAYGDVSFGKQTGGDILQNKKTFLYLKGLELCPPSNQNAYRDLYKTEASTEWQAQDKVAQIKTWWEEWGVRDAITNYLTELGESAHHALDRIHLNTDAKNLLRELGDALVWRQT